MPLLIADMWCKGTLDAKIYRHYLRREGGRRDNEVRVKFWDLFLGAVMSRECGTCTTLSKRSVSSLMMLSLIVSLILKGCQHL